MLVDYLFNRFGWYIEPELRVVLATALYGAILYGLATLPPA